MNKQLILNDYSKPDDKLLISKIFDKIYCAETKNKISNTDFLDLYQNDIANRILKKVSNKNYIFYGGIEQAERKMLVFYPEKLSELFNSFDNMRKNIKFINVIRIKLPRNLENKYTHRDYLGALMKLGIKREKIGDILVFNDGADIIVSSDIVTYLEYNLPSLTRFNKSQINIINIEEIRQKQINKETLLIIVPSLRVDCVVSELVNTSRNKANEIINQGRVFVNYENILKLTKQIKERDIITIRGKGKFEIDNIDGITRSGRVILKVNKFV